MGMVVNSYGFGSGIAPYVPPNYANVELLMVGEGTDAGTLFRDRSGNKRTMTPSGSAQVDTGINLQGTSTLLLSAGSSYLSTPSTADLQVGTSTDFTVEAYINCATLASHGTILSKRGTASSTNIEFDFFVVNDGTLAFQTFAAGFVVAGSAVGGALSTGTDYHVAATRSGTTLRIFVNGVQVATATQSGSVNVNTAPLYVGRNGTDGTLFDGSLNFVRFTVGQALYTSDFVPPVAADFFSYVEGTGPKVGLNAYDKHSELDLSGGWRTVTKTTANALRSVRATQGLAHTGSGYYEVRVDTTTSPSQFMMIGIGNASAALTTYPGGDANGWGYYQDDGHKYTGGADVGAMGASWKTASDIVQVAFKNGSLWFGKNNTWNGNPAAGTGAAFTGITGTLFPMLAPYLISGGTPDKLTARFHAWELTYSPPSGFNAWDV